MSTGPPINMQPGYQGYDVGLPCNGPTTEDIKKNQVQPIKTISHPWGTVFVPAAPAIVSGPEIIKKIGPMGSQIWGPYKKAYTNGLFGYLWRFPENIDGIIPLCDCDHIWRWARGHRPGQRDIRLSSYYAYLNGNMACVTDIRVNSQCPDGGPHFNLVINHPEFMNILAGEGGVVGVGLEQVLGRSSLLGGRKNNRKTQKKVNRKNKINTQKNRK